MCFLNFLLKLFKKRSPICEMCCPVCFESYLNINPIFALKCGHLYCSRCLFSMNNKFHRIKTKCAICSCYSNSILLDLSDLRCTTCKVDLFVINRNIEIVALNCGHIFCIECINITNNRIKCLACKLYRTPTILYP